MENDNITKKHKVDPEAYSDGKGFKKGNPGRPKGCLNKDTRARNFIIDGFIRRSEEVEKVDFKKLLDAVVALLPKKIQGEGFEGDKFIIIHNPTEKKVNGRIPERLSV